ncbi:MAG: SHOCT domain-containing protein [Gemmatimonadota bacterium]
MGVCGRCQKRLGFGVAECPACASRAGQQPWATRSPSPPAAANAAGAPVGSTRGPSGPPSTRRAPLRASGRGGELELSADQITITRSGVAGFLVHGLAGVKSIPLDSITAVQFRQAGPLVNGFIQFSIVGGVESRRGMWDAAADENTVVFTRAEEPEFQRIHRALESYRQQRRSAATAPLVVTVQGAAAPPESGIESELAQLERLAALRERGVLTDDEFARKKRQILGE